MEITVVFVHGWSVTNLDTYGELPLRLRAEAAIAGIDIQVKEIFLGRYISFHDEVRVGDISRAFEQAVQDQLGALLKSRRRFVCITHSTGGPVIRDWWHRYYPKSNCPMSHLIMMAPANYGSALAQLGKARVGRLKSWFEGVEPGQDVLDWLELGSGEAWALNKDWVLNGTSSIGPKGIFPFVLTGECIDRKFYDNLNTYTGEMGSDGVVRVAAANLESRFIKLVQPFPKKDAKGKLTTKDFTVEEFIEGPSTPLRILGSKSHSGDTMGIITSVRKETGEDKSSDTIKAILDCLGVRSLKDYEALYRQFETESEQVQESEHIETEKRLLLSNTEFIHDRYSMIIFRVLDSEGHPVRDYDLLITAGADSDPNHLPPGFFMDRQRNRVTPETITYFLDYDLMVGSEKLLNKQGKTVREATVGIDSLGFEIIPRPADGFVQYLPCKINASKSLFNKAVVANSTTMIEICLQRVVSKEVFRLNPLTGNSMPTSKQGSFKDVEPGDGIVQ